MKDVVVSKYGYTRSELKKVFDAVANKDNWKLPIYREFTLDEFDNLQAISEAVTFFTGSKAEFTHLGEDRFRVEATGYYWRIGV